MCCSWR